METMIIIYLIAIVLFFLVNGDGEVFISELNALVNFSMNVCPHYIVYTESKPDLIELTFRGCSTDIDN